MPHIRGDALSQTALHAAGLAHFFGPSRWRIIPIDEFADPADPSVSNITDGRVPGIFLWPGSVKPHVMRQPTSTLDLLPTLVDVIGRGEVGQSLY